MGRRRTAMGVAAASGALALAGHALYRAGGRRWRASEEQMVAAGVSLPGDLEHHFVRTDDGGRLHVVERGSGPAVVLVHGVMLSGAIWAHQLRELAGRHRVLAVDVRGHGQSLAGEDGHTMERLADDLLAALRALGVHDAVLAGHSLGGMIALHLACRRPSELRDHVASLGLIATTAGPVLPGPGHGRRAATVAALFRTALRFSARLGFGMPPRGDVAVWAARASFGARPLPEHVELTRSLISAVSPDAVAELVATILSYDVRRDLGGIDLPTWVLAGTRDVLAPPPAARLLHRSIPGSTLVPMPGAGHMLMLERAGRVSGLLDEMSGAIVPARS